MLESIIFGIIATIILFKINHPHITWGCMFGIHKYYYSNEKHGMHIVKDTNCIRGTQRKVYKCTCGKEKHAEDKDWI